MSKYDVTYHLAAGVRTNVENVFDDDIKAMAKALEAPDKVIVIQGRNTNRTQYIPVRNILVVETRKHDEE